MPASTANIGPGFDTLGLSLNLFSYIEIQEKESGLSMEVEGPEKAKIPLTCENIVFKAADAVFSRVGKRPKGLHFKMDLNAPVARGLGSSATAIVGGIVAANELLGNPLSLQEMADLANQVEGHPDNVVPTLVGGFISSVVDEGKVYYQKVQVPEGLKVVAAIPDFELLTSEAKKVIPQSLPLKDAIFNVSRAGLLIAALQNNRLDLLKVAMKDRIHQDYRAKLIPGMNKVLPAALEAGAFGAALSGAGPTLMAFTTDKGEAIGQAMVTTWKESGITARYLVLEPDLAGTIRVWPAADADG